MRSSSTFLLIVLLCCTLRAEEAFPGDGWWIGAGGMMRVAGHDTVILHFNRQEPPDVPPIEGMLDPWRPVRKFPNETWSVTVYRYDFEYGGPKSVKISQEGFAARIAKDILMVSDGEKVSSYGIESAPTGRKKLVLIDGPGVALGAAELAKSTKEDREEIRKQALSYFP